jgi:hypothetical protein
MFGLTLSGCGGEDRYCSLFKPSAITSNVAIRLGGRGANGPDACAMVHANAR